VRSCGIKRKISWERGSRERQTLYRQERCVKLIPVAFLRYQKVAQLGKRVTQRRKEVGGLLQVGWRRAGTRDGGGQGLGAEVGRDEGRRRVWTRGVGVPGLGAGWDEDGGVPGLGAEAGLGLALRRAGMRGRGGPGRGTCRGEGRRKAGTRSGPG
jgi:hypothetical protein